MTEYLTSQEAASYLGVNIRWFKELVKRGKIDIAKPARPYHLFKKKDLNTYTTHNKHT